MTFEQALEGHLKQLDEWYSEFRSIHSNPQVLNDKCTEFEDSRKKLEDISSRITYLKIAWNNASQSRMR